MAITELGEVIRRFRRDASLRDGAGMTDGQLLESFVSRRDEAAIEALVLRHGAMVWGVCRRLLPHRHDAEDAFQATFLVLLRRAGSVMPREGVANWLYGVARQTALKARETAARRTGRERPLADSPEPAAREERRSPELRSLLDAELGRLPERYRAVLLLCDLEGLTRKEAARQLGCPEGTVASRLMRARALLAKRLARHGLAVSGAGLAVLLPREALSASLRASALGVLTGFRAGHAAPAPVAALTEKVLKTMFLSKLKRVLLAGVLGLLAVGLGLTAYGAFARQPAEEGRPGPAAREPATRAAGKPEEEAGPRYCWLVFGPKAKARVLVRLDGKTVSVDRDGDGKFAGKGERFASEGDCKDVVIEDPDGKTSHVITSVHALHVVPPERFLEVRVRVRARGPLRFPQGGIVQMADRPEGAPEAHFNGPLEVAPKGWRIVNRGAYLLENGVVDLGPLLPQPLRVLAGKGLIADSTLPACLKRGGGPTELTAAVLTEGKGSWVCVCSPDDKGRLKSPFPWGGHPWVDVEFPAKKAGDPPVRRRYPLDTFSGDGSFRGPVPVPDEAGGGRAKVTFSFDDWKGAKVAPTTVTIPVEGPERPGWPSGAP